MVWFIGALAVLVIQGLFILFFMGAHENEQLNKPEDKE